MEDISEGMIEGPLMDLAERQVMTIKKEFFRMTMEGKWDEVAKLFDQQDEWAPTAKITNSGDTALHIAVSVGNEDNVTKLIQSIRDPSRLRQVLETGNDRGNTPLHSAASMGNVAVCQRITRVYPELVGCKNNNQETPLFMAALHGKKAAFFCLHSICQLVEGRGRFPYSRRKNGDTILHCAIAGDYFDLAFQIIQLYPRLASSVNEEGLTPLHILASKPSAFRSGSQLEGYDKIIYYCILVDQLEVEASGKQPEGTDSPGDKKNLNSEKYRIFNLLQLFWRMVPGKNRNGEETEIKIERKDTEKTDAENPGAKAGRLGVEQNFEREPSESSDALPSMQFMGRISPGNEERTPAYPENYRTCNDVFKLLWKMVLVGLSTAITKMESNKRKHVWAVQIMNELLELSMITYDEEASRSRVDVAELPQSRTNELEETMAYDLRPDQLISSETPPTDSMETTGSDGMEKTLKTANMILSIDSKSGINDIVKKVKEIFPISIQDRNAGNKNLMMLVDQDQSPEMPKKLETPILLAAKNGITEIVERILEVFPVAINDVNADNKNIVLLAVENRQPKVYELLKRRNILKESMFRQLDNEGNSALHLAAKLGECNKPLWISSAALQMQWENNWYEYIRDSMPLNFFPSCNEEGKTPSDLFTETHIELIKEGSEWLKSTAQSCSVITALIATVAFATSATVPGGFKGDSGIPALQTKPEFDLFAISSLLALCFSIISLVMFVSIITSRYQARDFGKILLRKLLLGLTSMILSIAAILISFCAGHFFVLRKELRSLAVPMYVITFLSILFFTLTQFSLFFDVLGVTFKKVPQRK
ncbi:hypothetical protein I3842_07G089300 [Carya illinoinensis]|uniref:PGG domain-containing protein n=1 Tax=Carya illinoinensis TaxID=32201 RepID=A0A922JCR3_CARIL|nr:hypothetical protein I3842_07G089300 [Carya illinoinensis]